MVLSHPHQWRSQGGADRAEAPPPPRNFSVHLRSPCCGTSCVNEGDYLLNVSLLQELNAFSTPVRLHRTERLSQDDCGGVQPQKRWSPQVSSARAAKGVCCPFLWFLFVLRSTMPCPTLKSVATCGEHLAGWVVLSRSRFQT